MILRFGDIWFDRGAREISRGGQRIHLSAKAFDLLSFLLERRPNAVAKAELQNQLWPDVFVAESNLPALITEIRNALGDDARTPRYVATVHRFGYAFRAPVIVGDRDQAASPCWLAGAMGALILSAGENVLGRDGTEAMKLDSPTVSRRHARIIVTGSSATLQDLGSKNGTFVNDAPVCAPVALREGDQVRIGSYVLTFRVSVPGGSTVTDDEAHRHPRTR